jgi:ABC-type transporter Mla subunit MlaD
MADPAGGVTIGVLGEIAAVLVPVAAGVAFLFTNTMNIVKAAVGTESDARDRLAKATKESIVALAERTTQLERNAATREDLAATEHRINGNIAELKSDIRDLRTSSSAVLEKLAGLKATLDSHPRGRHEAAE